MKGFSDRLIHLLNTSHFPEGHNGEYYRYVLFKGLNNVQFNQANFLPNCVSITVTFEKEMAKFGFNAGRSFKRPIVYVKLQSGQNGDSISMEGFRLISKLRSELSDTQVKFWDTGATGYVDPDDNLYTCISYIRPFNDMDRFNLGEDIGEYNYQDDYLGNYPLHYAPYFFNTLKTKGYENILIDAVFSDVKLINFLDFCNVSKEKLFFFGQYTI